MTNLTLNLNMALPIQETIHDLLDACGYRLVSQGQMRLKYINGDKRLVFEPGILRYDMFWDEEEADRKPEWSNMCELQYSFPVKTQQMSLLLQGIGAIDLVKLKSLIENISHADTRHSRPRTAMPGTYCVRSYGSSDHSWLAEGQTLATSASTIS